MKGIRAMRSETNRAERLDLATVLEVVRAVSGETDLEGLVATIMRLGLEHAGAERGLLILPSGDELRIEAEAETSSDGTRVTLRRSAVTAEALPQSALHHVVSTRDTILVHDASAELRFSQDEYVHRRSPRSVLCMPLLEHGRLVGLIYLESRRAPGVFTPARMALLELLATGAASSLESVRLRRDLEEREARVRRLVDSNLIGIVIWHADGRILDTNEAFLRIVGYDREELASGRVRWTELTPPEWHDRDDQSLEEIRKGGAVQAHEREYIRKDGSRVPVLAAGAVFDRTPDEGVAFVLDLTERKRAEQAQRESEREARLIVDSIPGLIAVFTPGGQVEFVNPQVLEYFGKTLEELRRWGTGDMVHPEDLPRAAEAFSRSIASGDPFAVEVRARRSDGVYRWFESRGAPLRGTNGHIVRWYNLLTDVDERKRAEEALAVSERTLKLTIDTIPALAWSTGPDGSADFFNQHYLDFVGLSAEQASGWGWMTAVHPDDLQVLATTWQRIMASGEPGETEARLRRRDGEYCWFLFRASPLRAESGEIVRWYGVNTNIEDRKRMEDALRSREAFLLDVQRLTRVGGWRYDVVRDVVANSLEIHRAYGVQPGDDVASTSFWLGRIHPDDRARVQADFERCLRERAEFRAAFRVVRPDGSIAYHHAIGHAVTNDAGELVEFIGAAIDMTEEWRASTELERASEALRELQMKMSRAAQVAAVGTLAASIAHEVNQPLSGIVTNTATCLRMLDADPPNVEGARETARRALRDGKRAADVISRLRALFGRKDMTLESVDLNEAIQEVIALSLRSLQMDRVRLRPELADDLPPVVGDRVQLQQVVQNLILNAVEAMREVHDRPRELTIRTAREDGDRVRVSVRDTGVGVDPAGMEPLFDAFYTTKPAGMGIGLSISRSIVERHDGRLWAEPNDGPGATFAFSMPRRAQRITDAAAGRRTS